MFSEKTLHLIERQRVELEIRVRILVQANFFLFKLTQLLKHLLQLGHLTYSIDLRVRRRANVVCDTIICMWTRLGIPTPEFAAQCSVLNECLCKAAVNSSTYFESCLLGHTTGTRMSSVPFNENK